MNAKPVEPSHLFTVRVWLEKLEEGVLEMRFQAKHVPSSESRLFRDGDQLLAYLRDKVAVTEVSIINLTASTSGRG
jgi:hypothetical protein